jgi:hypothetical protein
MPRRVRPVRRIKTLLFGIAVCLGTLVWSHPRDLSARDAASCPDADQRMAKAQLRMTLSLFRSRTSVLRIISELRRLGIFIEMPTRFGESEPEASQDSPILVLTRVQELSDFALRSMRNYQNGTVDDRPAINRPDVAAIDGSGTSGEFAASSDCIRNALWAESVAFRAEQAAQLAEVAADQAISLADHATSRYAK